MSKLKVSGYCAHVLRLMWVSAPLYALAIDSRMKHQSRNAGKSGFSSITP